VKLTNKYNLPETLINLHHKQRRDYAETKTDADASVTQLIRSPRIDLLRKAHWHEMEEDISERLWAILGTVIHVIMVDGKDEEHIPEEVLFARINGWKIKGGLDVRRRGNRVAIIDYKFTKAFKYQKGDFADWEEQLNCYAYLIRKVKGFHVDELEVVMFVRDFTQSLADVQKDYPPASSIPVPIPLWDEDKQERFIRRKIKEHQDARRGLEWGEPLPLCADEDRWKRESDWAVMKKGGSRAVKGGRCNTEKKAKKVLKEYQTAAAAAVDGTKKKPNEYEIIEREDPPTRCIGNYCGVNKWCDQWKKEEKKWQSK